MKTYLITFFIFYSFLQILFYIYPGHLTSLIISLISLGLAFFAFYRMHVFMLNQLKNKNDKITRILN